MEHPDCSPLKPAPATGIAAPFSEHRNWPWNLFFLILATALLIPRLDRSIYFPGHYLWAEDGKVFLSQAPALGIASLWEPYSGYLHAYPRLISLISNYFGLVNRPSILLAGWFGAYLFLISVLIGRARSLGLSPVPTLFIVCLTSLQPNLGENFFNITNSQWMLGAAFSIWLLTLPDAYEISVPRLLLLILLGLTGPFSILLLPVLSLRALLIKDVRKNLWVYLVVLACALTQLYFFIHSDRITSGVLNQHVREWFVSFVRINLFQSDDLLALGSALIFWAALLVVLIYRSNMTTMNANLKIQLWLIPLTSILFVIAAVYSSKEHPSAIVFLGSGNRYSWIPCTLIFFGAILAANSGQKMKYGLTLMQTLVIACAAIVCHQNFHSVSLPDLQFKSFANFSEYSDVSIPVSPQWPLLPGWHINIKNEEKRSLDSIEKRDLMESSPSETSLLLVSNADAPPLFSSAKIVCSKASDLGLEININKASDGWVRVFWSETPEFKKQNSLKRWYPAGLVRTQFAFPYINEGMYVGLQALESSGSVEITLFKIYCLP